MSWPKIEVLNTKTLQSEGYLELGIHPDWGVASVIRQQGVQMVHIKSN